MVDPRESLQEAINKVTLANVSIDDKERRNALVAASEALQRAVVLLRQRIALEMEKLLT